MSDPVSLRASAFPMLGMSEAFEKIHAAARRIAPRTHRVAVGTAALGLTLAEDVRCGGPVPPVACSRLDGYAVRAADVAAGGEYAVADMVRAGDAARAVLPPGAVAWVTTGAPMPPGSDAVVMVEQTRAVVAGGESSGAPGREGRVVITASVGVGEGVRAAGSDLAAGSLVAAAGSVLHAGTIATLLSCNARTVLVVAAPCVGIMSTGDEVVDAGADGDTSSGVDASAAAASPSGGGFSSGARIVDSNRPMLAALVRGEAGAAATPVDCGIVKDRFSDIQSALVAALSPVDRGGPRLDILVTTGGVSMGDRDYVKPALQSLDGMAVPSPAGGVTVLSCEVLFGRLNMKPGKPATCALVTATQHASTCAAAAVGASRDAAAAVAAGSACSSCHGSSASRLVFALPGNPVSAWACFHLLVAPAMRCMAAGGGGITAGAAAGAAPVAMPRSLAAFLPPTATVTLLAGVPLDTSRPEYHRAIVWAAPAGSSTAGGGSGSASNVLYARSTGNQASSRIASVIGANALLELPAASTAGSALRAPCAVKAYLLGPLANPEHLPPAMRDPTAITAVSAAASSGGCRCGVDHDAADHHAAASAPSGGAATAATHPSHSHDAAAHASAVAAMASPSSGATPSGGPAPAAADRLPVTAYVLTVSDRCHAGTAVDKSGPFACDYLTKKLAPERLCVTIAGTAVVPDDTTAIAGQVKAWMAAATPPAHLVVTTGGTGFSPRDVTPEALRPLIARPAPGLVHAMFAYGMSKTPLAALSRYEAGVTETGALLLELPGSTKAVQECLDAVAGLVPHALNLLR